MAKDFTNIVVGSGLAFVIFLVNAYGFSRRLKNLWERWPANDVEWFLILQIPIITIMLTAAEGISHTEIRPIVFSSVAGYTAGELLFLRKVYPTKKMVKAFVISLLAILLISYFLISYFLYFLLSY